MRRLFFVPILCLASVQSMAQERTVSVGLYSGIVLPYTVDAGINQDPRYSPKSSVKFAPIGLSYSLDGNRFGFLFTPGIASVGQNFYVVGTDGAHKGMREIDMKYLNFPFALKINLIKVSFMRVSALAAVSGAFLLSGEEFVSHSEARLAFPQALRYQLPPDYVYQQDGGDVLAPAVDHYPMLKNEDFKPFQFFVGGGLRSEWDLNYWRISADFRYNYGLTDPREDNYKFELEDNNTIYDLPGKRNDTFISVNLGIARYISFDRNDKQAGKKFRSKSKKGGGKKPAQTKKPVRKRR